MLSAVGDETYTYTYDDVGNVLTANGHTYTYGDTNWRDLLTAYDGETITYDASGNPLSYYNGTRWTFTWENGRSLATATDGANAITYSYDANGLRTSKVVNGVTHNYLYASGQLMRETYGSNTLDFFYDANGYPYALNYNGTTYYYITNLQGDVMYLIDANENTVASYEYDPYGNIVSAVGAMAEINPLRYRGYYYDAELEMYYLQSRYYDPQVGRFVNADVISVLGVSGTVIGYNLFTYCESAPINRIDEHGFFSATVTRTGNNKYRFNAYFTDSDIRNIKAGILTAGAIAAMSLGIVGAAGGIPSMGISAVAAGIAAAIVSGITTMAGIVIDYYDYGKGATFSFAFGISSYNYYTPRYGWYRAFWGYKWGIVGLTRKTAYVFYLRSLPNLVWNK